MIRKQSCIIIRILSMLAIIFMSFSCATKNERGEEAKVFSVSVTYNAGTEDHSGIVPVDATAYDVGATVTVLDNTGNLAGSLVEGPHIGSGIRQRFLGWSTNSEALTVDYVAKDTFTITEDTPLYAVYTTGTDVLRKVGPAGGWVFYDAGSIQSWGRYLEVAPQSTEWESIQWANEGIEVPGTKNKIGEGKANTALIIAVLNAEPEEINRAAQLCATLSYGGYDDWYLPTQEELQEICWILHSRRYDWGERMTEDNPTYGEDRVGGFVDRPYWSSVEYDIELIILHSFITGAQAGMNRSGTTQVRAVRAF